MASEGSRSFDSGAAGATWAFSIMRSALESRVIWKLASLGMAMYFETVLRSGEPGSAGMKPVGERPEPMLKVTTEAVELARLP